MDPLTRKFYRDVCELNRRGRLSVEGIRSTLRMSEERVQGYLNTLHLAGHIDATKVDGFRKRKPTVIPTMDLFE